MSTPLTLVSLVVTQPTATVRSGSFLLIADQGSGGGPLTFNMPGVTLGNEGMYASGVGYNQAGYTKSGLAPGTYNGQVLDASPSHLAPLDVSFTIDPIPTVPGCTDPTADNYDPNATDDNGSCTFSQRLNLAALPDLAPLGVPFWVSLASVTIAANVPAPATCLLNFAGLGTTPGVQVRIDGYLFTSGPLVAPTRFAGADSLLAALQAQPGLSGRYLFTLPTATSLLITATAPGLPAAPVVTTTDPVAVALTATPGVAQLWSQSRYRWGCYLEVWAGCGDVYGGPVDKSTAVLAQRFPSLPVRADNVYEFNIAPALRQYTGHGYPLADGSCPDRLISYFLRFGEEYADNTTGLGRVRSVYESGVAWGIEAMELPPLVASGLRLLSTRPSPWVVRRGDLVPALLLAAADSSRRVLLRHREATSRTTANEVLPHEVATGQVTQANNRLLAPAGVLTGELLDSDSHATEGEVIVALDFSAKGQPFSFINRVGGKETVYFAGIQDENQKRAAANYTNAAGSQNLSAELNLTPRLYSGLLDRPTWDWLRRELAVSPTAWLETAAGEVPVGIADVAAVDDATKGEYSIYVDYTPGPVRGLSN